MAFDGTAFKISKQEAYDDVPELDIKSYTYHKTDEVFKP